MQYFLCGLSVFAPAGTCLQSHCLAEAVSYDSINMASWHDVTLISEVVGCGISYAVWVVSFTQ
jgi:hypothetical protein